MRQIKALCLFAILGAAAGIWIAGQARRSMHVRERAVPRFSLTELIAAAIAWSQPWHCSPRGTEVLSLSEVL